MPNSIKDKRNQKFFDGMKPKTIIIAILGALMLASCSDWTRTESVRLDIKYPWDQDPELWEDYKASLRAYKQTDHFLVYARLENSPERPANEKSFMRSLPDSLDIVSLTNADNFSRHDAEDMEWMRSVGTKVLYQIDFASRRDELSDAAKLGAYLDRAIASVRGNGLDGWSFTGTAKLGDALNAELSSLIVSRLSAARQEGQLLVFEGDPAFVSSADRQKIDLFVLGTEGMDYVHDVHMAVLSATSSLGIAEEKILLAASLERSISDEKLVENDAVMEMAEKVMAFGPLRGIAVYDLGVDYYSYDGNYVRTRQVIQTLNHSR